jgi:hypothetical protein
MQQHNNLQWLLVLTFHTTLPIKEKLILQVTSFHPSVSEFEEKTLELQYDCMVFL